MKTIRLLICLLLLSNFVFSQDKDIQKKLTRFDKEMEQNMKDWNIPGVGIGIVKNGKLVFV